MPSNLLSVAHRAASVGWVYDFIQFLAGAPIVRYRLGRYLEKCRGRVLDIGGGTGSLASLLPPGCSYTCLDNEMSKLHTCAAKAPGSPLLADATRMPIKSGSINVVTCVCVTHHLTYDQLHAMLQESARVLNPDGSLILMDAVLNPGRLPGRILWKLDRGAYPKPSTDLRQAVERHFCVEQWARLAVYHEYAVFVCRKRPAPVADRSV
jgi:ubiquinone/menaquinone biosynthesis C-methylase UbiE